MKRHLTSLMLALCAAFTSSAASFYTSRIVDPRAAYLTSDQFPVRADGVSDDTAAIQSAIDKVQQTTGQGILFVPPGRYRLSKAIYIWPGIRVIGYGEKRPVFVLADNTPGFQSGPAYMFFFAGARPGAGLFSRGFMFRSPTAEEDAQAQREAARFSGRPRPARDAAPPDANPGTFYSAMSNVDIEIGAGNPGAAAVRAHYAQHCFLAHMDFFLGSALTGIQDGGNLAEDLHFHGGQYGVITRKPSPGWQFTLVDTTFEDQTVAAIKEHEAGLTLVRPFFKHVPSAIAIDPDYADELWVKNARMEDISGPAVIISDEASARTEINFEDVVCRRVPVFASFRTSGKKIEGPSAAYVIRSFSHGLRYAHYSAVPAIETHFDAKPSTADPALAKSDVPALPPTSTWTDIRKFGAKGDGEADDTEALRKAIASSKAIYLPLGAYRVTDTILLKPDTVLIGLHPSGTRVLIADDTPAFAGIGNPKAVLETPKGGANIVSGIGVYTNGANPRAVAIKWMAGADSLMNDVRFLGGHGTSKLNGASEDIYNNTHTADPNPARHWDSQYPSLWVTDGGGGTFMDIWTPNTFSQAGMYVSDTSTEGRVYEMSSEHHVRSEIKLHNVANWHIYALQTEEERGEGGFALPLEIDHSHNVTIANLHQYRVVSMFQPFPYAVKVSDSTDIHFRNLHCYSDSKASFDNSLYDGSHHIEIRQREFAWLDIPTNEPAVTRRAASPVLAPGAKVEKLAGGFFNLSGATVDTAGRPYLVDAHWQRILRWLPNRREMSVVRDSPLEPVNLAFDRSGNLLVVSYAGKGVVYSFKPDAPGDEIALLKPVAASAQNGKQVIVPIEFWRNEHDFERAVIKPKPYQFISPDGSTFIPAGEDFVTGQLYYGSKIHDVIRAFGLTSVKAGQNYYVCDENEEKTYTANVNADGTLSDLKLFAERGGEAVITDAKGNVYIAAGQIYVYSAAGKLIDTIEVPERPAGLVFGGSDRKTLFIPARTSLYSVRVQ
jgi:hypothetical protein